MGEKGEPNFDTSETFTKGTHKKALESNIYMNELHTTTRYSLSLFAILSFFSLD